MEINCLGHSCFRFKTKIATLVTDPFDPEKVGFKYPELSADIVTVSHPHPDHDFLDKVKGEPFVVDGPGEYEVKGISVFGVASYHDDKKGKERGQNTIYTIETEGLKICHLGDLGEKLNEEQLEEIGGVDILLIPVGGVYTIDFEEAVEIIDQIEPKIVIPMHYKERGMTKDFDQLAGVDEFLKSLGVEVTPVSRLTINKDKLPEEREVVVLSRKFMKT